MNLVTQVQVWLAGKKTHIIAILIVVDGAYQYFIQNGSNWHTLAVYLLAGGGLSALRAGISKQGVAK